MDEDGFSNVDVLDGLFGGIMFTWEEVIDGE